MRRRCFTFEIYALPSHRAGGHQSGPKRARSPERNRRSRKISKKQNEKIEENCFYIALPVPKRKGHPPFTPQRRARTLLVMADDAVEEPPVAPPAPAAPAAPAPAPAPAPAAAAPVVPDKVVVLLKATGDAPILKQNKFKITSSDRFEKVVGFLSNQLGKKQIFVYLNSAFTPSYDETVANLYSWHGVEGKLVVNYALQQAWG